MLGVDLRVLLRDFLLDICRGLEFELRGLCLDGDLVMNMFVC